MDFLDFEVAFRGGVPLLPALFTSAECPAAREGPVPREGPGRGALGKGAATLLASRVRNESSVSEITGVFVNPETEGV